MSVDPYRSPLLADAVTDTPLATPSTHTFSPSHSRTRSPPRVDSFSHAADAGSASSDAGEESTDGEEEEDVDDVRVLCCSLRMYNVLVLSFSLMFIFTAFNTIQAWVTNLLSTLGYSNLGNDSLTVLYVAVCVSLFLTPPLVAAFTQIYSIIIGAVCYVLYMASLIVIVPPVVLVASAVNGFGASLLWVAVGGLLTKCSSAKDRGRNTGIFWSIFQLSLILGNVIGIVVSASSYTLLFIVFTLLGGLGTVLLFGLRRFPSDVRHREQLQQRMILSAQGEEVPNAPVVPDEPQPSTAALLRSLWQLFTSSSLLLLIPAFCFQGLEFSFWNGEFPLLIPTEKLGIVMLWAGVGEAMGGLTMGTLSDRVGRSLTWLLACVVYVVALAGMYAMRQQLTTATAVTVSGVSLLAYVSAFCFGLSDAAINTQIYSILGNKYKSAQRGSQAAAASDRRVVAAFTCFNLCQNVAAAIGFFYQPLWHVIGNQGDAGDWLGSDVQLYVQMWLMVAGAVGFVCCDRGWFATKEELEVEREREEEEAEEAEEEEQQQRDKPRQRRDRKRAADGAAVF